MKNVFAHIELSTGNPAKAAKFYKSLFAWKLTDLPMGVGTYTMVDTGSEECGGGIQEKMMPEAPTAWLSYVHVEDVKKTLAKAKKLGAKVVMPWTDIGEFGAIGIFTDPTGATLGVWERAKPKAKAKKPAKKSRK
ncbi:MAG: VOC family protein [Myxococcales bacterium]